MYSYLFQMSEFIIEWIFMFLTDVHKSTKYSMHLVWGTAHSIRSLSPVSVAWGSLMYKYSMHLVWGTAHSIRSLSPVSVAWGSLMYKYTPWIGRSSTCLRDLLPIYFLNAECQGVCLDRGSNFHPSYLRLHTHCIVGKCMSWPVMSCTQYQSNVWTHLLIQACFFILTIFYIVE
jgi:hypothetical protein